MGRPFGNPDKYPFNAQQAEEICDLVAEGQNLHVIGQLGQYPPRWRIYQWLRESPEFAANYARAREDRADWRSSRIDSITAKLLQGKIDPGAARVAIDAEKWQAGKEKPATYGDKGTVEISGANGGPIQLQAQKIPALSDDQLLKIAHILERGESVE